MANVEKDIVEFVAKGKQKDNFRPDVRVSILSAKVSSIDESGKSFNIVFKIPGQKYSHNGYISANEQVYKLLSEAKKLDKIVIVRLERKRKKTADPKASIMDLTKDMETAKNNSVKITSGIYDENNQRWILTSEAESEPSEDPEKVKSGIASVNIDEKAFFQENASKRVKGSKELKARADSLLNLYFFLLERANKSGTSIEPEKLNEYTKLLETSCNYIQKNNFKIKSPVYGDYSYTRVRYLLFNYADHVNDLNKDVFASDESMKSWARDFIKYGTQLWEWAFKEAKQ